MKKSFPSTSLAQGLVNVRQAASVLVDCCAGTAVEEHQSRLRRLEQAVGKPASWGRLTCELWRDGNRNVRVRA